MTWPRDIGRLAIAGATAFWIANLLISLTPVAADYRSALSIRYVPMLIEAALRGLLITTCLSWLLLTFPDRIPGRTPVCPRMARQAPPATKSDARHSRAPTPAGRPRSSPARDGPRM